MLTWRRPKRRSTFSRDPAPDLGVRPSRRRGPRAFPEYSQGFVEGYRVADSALDRYELHVGVGSAPDMDDAPSASSASLPVSWVPPGPGTYYLVLRKRNAYGLEGFNVLPTIVQVDGGGLEVLGPVSPPRDVVAYDAGSAKVRVVAKYLSSEDRHPADRWEVYVKFGADPVPGVDTPAYTGVMAFVGFEAMLSVVLSNSSWISGATAHIVVTAKRTADSGRGSAPVVLHALAASLDLATGELFGGGAVFEQE